jgi:tRNA modification GTPase
MNTTIAAVSTAYGEGGIGIVRISGPLSGEILDKMFSAASGRKSAPHIYNDRHLYYGHVEEPSSAEIIDEVLAVYMIAPHTYTGEDVCEIHCHGSVVSLRKILELAYSLGAEPAEAGEFTKRAFLNGRLDLAQAEAVIDVVRAKTDESAGAAIRQLEGKLSRKLADIREILTEALAEAIVNMDYPDEDEDPNNDDSAIASISEKLRRAQEAISELITSAETGRMIRDGIDVVIAGKANVGKSSLLNALLKENRAIVTATPGTTRDSIEEYISLRGIPVKLTDTAGIRKTGEEAEIIGIERSEAAAKAADLVVLMVDGSKPLDREDAAVIDLVCKCSKKFVVAINKSDLPQLIDETSLLPDGGAMQHLDMLLRNPLHISAITDDGVSEVEDYIVQSVYGGSLKQGESLLVTNARHKDLLIRANAELKEAGRALMQQGTPDFAEMNTRTARDLLGEITGETSSSDILDKVFERFCIGK